MRCQPLSESPTIAMKGRRIGCSLRDLRASLQDSELGLLASGLPDLRSALVAMLVPLAYVTAYHTSDSIIMALGASACMSLVYALLPIGPARQRLRLWTLSAVAIALGAAGAGLTGQPRGFFLVVVLTPGIYASILWLSLALRRPLPAVIIQLLTGRTTRELAGPTYRAYVRITLAWAMKLTCEAVVMAYLYLENQLLGLAIARFVFGWLLSAALFTATFVALANLRDTPPQ